MHQDQDIAIVEAAPPAGGVPVSVFEEDGFQTRRRPAPDPGQASLFPAEALIVPEYMARFRKAVAAIHAVPTAAQHAQTLTGRKIFDACIIVVQLESKKLGPEWMRRVKEDRVSPIFEVRISDFARLASIPGKNYVRIYEELDRLFETIFRWNILSESADIEWEMKSHFFSSLGYGKGAQKGLIRFSLDPSVLEIVLEPSNWAALSLQALEGLHNAYAYALYSNAFRYLNTYAKVTAALPVATWVELLIGPCGYLEKDERGGLKVVRYADFKRRVLVEAMRKVNSLAALSYTLELKELCQGKKVVKIQFKFVAKKVMDLGIPLTWPAEVVAALTELGFAQKEIQDMSLARSYVEVAEALVRMRDAEIKRNASGQKINHRKRYFEGILQNVAKGVETDDIDKIDEDFRIAQARQAAEERKERLQKEFSLHAAQVFSAALAELSDDDLAALTKPFENSQAGRAVAAFFDKGWRRPSAAALQSFRAWLAKHRSAQFEELLPDPKDRGFEAWMAWRIEAASDVTPAGGALAGN